MSVRASIRIGKLGVVLWVTLNMLRLETRMVLVRTLRKHPRHALSFLRLLPWGTTPIATHIPPFTKRVHLIVLPTLLWAKPLLQVWRLKVPFVTHIVLVLQRSVTPTPLTPFVGVRSLTPLIRAFPPFHPSTPSDIVRLLFLLRTIALQRVLIHLRHLCRCAISASH